MENNTKLEIRHINKVYPWNCGKAAPNTTNIKDVTCFDCLAKQPKANMTLNQLVTKCHDNAVTKGWWNPGNTTLEVHMLIVSEIVEATEEVRNNKFHFYIKDGKPEGEAVELADAIIRIADYFGQRGWNLEEIISKKMEYNKTRPHRHGDKKH